MRTCIECKHWCVVTAHADWSEYTPGNEWTMNCDKDKWFLDAGLDGEEGVAKKLDMANNCDSFVSRKK